MIFPLTFFIAPAAAAVLGGLSNDQPVRYIVEFDTSAHLNSTIQARGGPHAHFYAHLDARSVTYEVQSEFHETGLFVGASVEVSPEDVKKLAKADGVVNVYPVQYYEAPAPISPTPLPSPSPSPNNLTARAFEYGKYSVLPSIQVDRVHAQGITGSGVKVAVIDSGVDFNLAALGGGFGPGFKVEGGYDLVGPSYGSGGAPTPGDVPFDNCNGHGTLVAGLISGNDNDYHSPGVAPDAKIYAYRIFGCSGSTSDDLVIDAMLRAVRDGCDVINLSLGAATGWSTSASSIVASRIAESGVQTVISAGNNGVNGAFYPSSPATGRDVLSVGAVQTAGAPALSAIVDYANPVQFTYSGIKAPAAIGPHPFFATDSLACGTLPGGDLSGHVVVVRRGQCDFATKVATAKGRGAVGVFVYNNVAGSFGIVSGVDALPLSQAVGELLVQNYRIGSTITLSAEPTLVPNANDGKMVYFSSIGPSFDMSGSPHISAPGQNIFGPTPAAMGNWTVMSGTSFAAPITAGAAALYISAKGRSAVAMRNAFQSTAKPVAYDSTPDSVAYAGAGMLQVYDAIFADTIVSRSEMMLNDTQYNAGSRYIVVRNDGAETKEYTIKHVPAHTVYALESSDTRYMSNNPQHDARALASVSFSLPSFSLRPGQSLPVLMSIQAPKIDGARLPIYSGYIEINGGNVPVRVSYLGLAARLRDVPVFEGSARYFGYQTPAMLVGTGSEKSATGRVYTWQGSDYPSIIWRLLMGTAYLSVDLVNADQALPFTADYPERRAFVDELPAGATDVLSVEETTFDINGVLSRLDDDVADTSALHRRETSDERACRLGRRTPVCAAYRASLAARTYDAVPVLGNIYSRALWARSHNNAAGDQRGKGDSYYLRIAQPTFSNGDAIPNGNYRFLMRALRVNGDRAKQADYDSWVSPAFTIRR